MRWMIRLAAVTVGLLLGNAARASDLGIRDARLVRSEGGSGPVWHAEFAIAWKNAWRNERNNDGAWVFLKVRAPGRGWRHAMLASAGHGAIPTENGPAAELHVASDAVGAFIAPAIATRGSVAWAVRLALDARTVEALERIGPTAEVAAFGVEMVRVPEGAFWVGEPGQRAVEHAAFYRCDAQGRPAGRYRVENESPIEVGPVEGMLHYGVEGNFAIFAGDRQGPVPAEFPKGFASFWCMKYELTQGQYAEFLNQIPASDTAHRALGGGLASLAPDSRLSIRVQDGRFVADHPARPANWVSWDDGCAWADWAGLRPMTEMEFAKACRGPGEPPADDFPWGTASKEGLKRVMGPDLDLVRTGDADEATLTDDRREPLGASYYWIMDLAGSVWERCVTIGHPRGRAFKGTHGDGALNMGFATNEDWPASDHAPSWGGGYGYRGGGHYEAARVYEPGHFNPHSPVGWRRFGSWGQGPRSIAYGFRAVRTVDVQ